MKDAKYYMEHVNTDEYKQWEASRATGFKPASLNIIEPLAVSGHELAVEVMKKLNPDWQPPKKSRGE